MFIVKFIFWTSLFLLVYPYVIYPPLIALLARLFPRNQNLEAFTAQWPTVTLIISAFNEEKVIADKLANALSLEYPRDKLHILVISDASDDNTDSMVEKWSVQNPQIKLLRQNERLGKTSGLNVGVDQSNSSIIVFSDANAMYSKNALIELVKFFRDERVGYVVGAALYNKVTASEANQSEDLYWNYELSMKKWESDFYSVVGGDGAIYAIRRELYWELEKDDINDFINPLQIIANNYIGIFNPLAICYEDAADDFTKEYQRKRRIVNRSWRAFRKSISSLSLFRHGRFLFELLSHKVIRWFSFLFIIFIAFSSATISIITSEPIYILVLAGVVSSTIVALFGRFLDQRKIPIPRLVSLAYYFFFVNYAALLGIIDNIIGIRHITWNHVRNSK